MKARESRGESLGHGAPAAGNFLTLPARSTIRVHPLQTERVLLTPIDPADGPELWTVVDGSRWHLERWLPWVPFNNTPEASQRYAEAWGRGGGGGGGAACAAASAALPRPTTPRASASSPASASASKASRARPNTSVAAGWTTPY